MKPEIITLPLGSDLVSELAGMLAEKDGDERDFSRTAVVFPGRRPGLFFRRSMARRLGQAFFPPACFSIDDFVDFLVVAGKDGEACPRPLSDLEGAYFVYRAAREIGVGEARQRSFADFLPWAEEMLAFLEQLELEMVPDENLLGIEKSAEIGYEVPAAINRLLEDSVELRNLFRSATAGENRLSRAARYRLAAESGWRQASGHFERVVFAGFYYLSRAESLLVRSLAGEVDVLFVAQGEPGEWPVLERGIGEIGGLVTRAAGAADPSAEEKMPEPEFLAGFDTHSQAALVRDIVEKIPAAERDETVIVLPDAVSLLPLFSEIAGISGDFNVSLGYPLGRSPWAGLFEAVLAAQESRREGAYYTRDYLAVLKHPMVKNLRLPGDPAVTRILSHQVEEALLGLSGGGAGGSVFIELEQIESSLDCREVCRTLQRLDITCGEAEPAEVLRQIHHHFFVAWQPGRIATFAGFAAALEVFFDFLVEHSTLVKYPLNRFFGFAVLETVREMSAASFREEGFSLREMFLVFDRCLKNRTVRFRGSPLRGMQVLGMLETRALSFRRAIVMDASEGVLPALRTVEPLVPREAMAAAGLRRQKEEEEIQYYHFRRLLAGATFSRVVYSTDAEKEPSRYVAQLLWEKERRAGKLSRRAPAQATFRLETPTSPEPVEKSRLALAFLDSFTWSASALNEYLACPCRFYHRYILGLREKDEIADEPEAVETGNFLHRFLARFYEPWQGGRPVIDGAFRARFEKELGQFFELEMSRRLRSGSFLARQVLFNRMKIFLDREAERESGEIIGLEGEIKRTLVTGACERNFICRVDRLERLADGRLLVIDYKSGRRRPGDLPRAEKKGFPGTDESLGRREIRRLVGSFQAPLYVDAVSDLYGGDPASALFIYLRGASPAGFPDESNGREEMLQFSRAALAAVLREVYNPDMPFERDTDSCVHCPFVAFCR